MTKRSNSKTCYIPKTNAMNLHQYIAQQKNKKLATKIEQEQMKRTLRGKK